MTEDLRLLVGQLNNVVAWLKHRHVSRWRMAFAAFVALTAMNVAGLYLAVQNTHKVADASRAAAVRTCRSGNDVRQSLRIVVRGFQRQVGPGHSDAFDAAVLAFHDRDCTLVARRFP